MAVIPILDSVTLQVNGPAFFRVYKPNKAVFSRFSLPSV